ncbi:hypothetical protein [Streptomyces sp. ISL-100]|uniref:hypothetical protein n=1 Tax=Streptomyces sp. ISL-100 TaxID=2819173 RepID=UPI001BEB878C|nr:hypothetical protein [Streptomyces sp. ISL-100]MBT2400644.1 hypothetical protein [Streptomyces sp. ISL-100]
MTSTDHLDESYADYMETAHGEPVAVEIKASTPIPIKERPTRVWSSGQVELGPERPQQIGSAHPSRVRLRVKNLNAAVVYLAPNPETCTPTSSYPLDTKETVEFTTRHPVYALGADFGAKVSVIAEHLDG